MSNLIYFKKIVVRCIALLLVCFAANPILAAQEETAYLVFEATGIIGGQVKTVTNGKFVNVLTPGGYVNVQFTDFFKNTPNISSHAYAKDKSAQTSYNLHNSSLYLYPGTKYFFDVFETTTNKLIKRYILERPKIYPQITFSKPDGEHLFTTKNNGNNVEINLKPDEKIRFKIKQRMDFKEMEVEYSLRNLKTRQMQYGIIKHEFKDFVFATNTDYELRVNYVIQKESVSLTYIHVKPNWYQSSINQTIVLLLLLIVGGLLLLLKFKKKINSSQKEQQKLEQAAIRLQSLLNPHFTFNALSSIQGLMNTNRIDEANLYLQEFSSLLRQTLTKSQQVYSTLDQELKIMRLYIKLEAFRFNFSWEIEVSSDLNTTIIEIPTLLLQPLVENAIKHGLSKMGDQGKLKVSCTVSQKHNTFVIQIQDSGKWLNTTDMGYGLTLTKERIATINQMKKDQYITLEFDKNKGTKAILTFHNWIEN